LVNGASGHIEIIQPAAFARPKGYANGVLARGRLLSIAGQIGWDERQQLVGDGLVEQFARALDNVLAVVAAAGGGPGDVVEMTVFVTDLDAYRQGASALGPIWKARFGRHYPAMALVGVSGLVEAGAKVEILARAVLADEPG
jgi:enamine deaminase RidA (YjgF/YER057c/UK114 family)